MTSKTIIANRYSLMANKVINALNSRGYTAMYCETAADAARTALSFIPEGTSVSWGGSLTIEESGLIELLKNGNYNVLDRADAKTPEQRAEITRSALTCDTFLSSVNALSEDGIIINIDGMCNRIAAIAYGPKSVILMVGMNKICKDVAAARSRARNFAAPNNAVRLSTDTPCAKDGMCHDCNSPACICSQIVEMRRSREKDRIKVILVGETLGL